MSLTDRPEAEDWVSSALTVPNLLSAFRILLVPLFIWTFLERQTTSPWSFSSSPRFPTFSTDSSPVISTRGAAWAQFWIRPATSSSPPLPIFS